MGMNEPKRIYVGAICEVSKAYSMDDRAQTIMDEIAGCECEVLAIHRDDSVDIWVKNMGEFNTSIRRMRPLR